MTQEVVLIVFLAEIYHLDLEYLLLLYDRLREDFFFFFFLFAGRQITVPKHAKMIKMLGFSSRISNELAKGKELDPATRQEVDVCNRLRSLWDADSKKVLISMDIQQEVVSTPHASLC